MLPSFFAVGLWAFSVLAAKRSSFHVGSAAANLGRLSLATVVLAAWAHLFGRGLTGDSLPWFVLSGVIGFGIGDIAGFECIARLGARLSSLLIGCLSAPFAIGMEWLWLDTTVGPRQLLCGGIILAGVAIALAPKDHLHLAPRQLLSGVLLAVIAAFGQGAGAVVSRKAFQVATLTGHSIDGVTATYQRALGGLVLIGLFQLIVLYRERTQHPGKPPRQWAPALPWIAGQALTGPVLGVSCYQWALATTPTGIVMPILALTPLAVIPLACWLDGDRPSARSLLGGAVAVAGSVGLTLVQ